MARNTHRSIKPVVIAFVCAVIALVIVLQTESGKEVVETFKSILPWF